MAPLRHHRLIRAHTLQSWGHRNRPVTHGSCPPPGPATQSRPSEPTSWGGPTHLGQLGDAPGPVRGRAAVGGSPAPRPGLLHGPQGARLQGPQERRLQRVGEESWCPGGRASERPVRGHQALASNKPCLSTGCVPGSTPGAGTQGTHGPDPSDKLPACPHGADSKLNNK